MGNEIHTVFGFALLPALGNFGGDFVHSGSPERGVSAVWRRQLHQFRQLISGRC